MTTVHFEFITGMSLGIEYVEPGLFDDDEEEIHYLAVDLLILRLVFAW